MKKEKIDIEKEQKKLVLERFKTLNPESKIILGDAGEVTVKKLIEHIKAGDSFGKNIVRVQIKMLQFLAQSS